LYKIVALTPVMYRGFGQEGEGGALRTSVQGENASPNILQKSMQKEGSQFHLLTY